jgi:hypothetical protein
MIKLKIKILSENKTFSKTEIVPEEFIISKANSAFESMVDSAVKESGLKDPEEVRITASFEW